MRAKTLVWMFGLALMVGGVRLSGQSADTSLTGKWQVTAEFYGTPTYAPLQLQQDGTKLTGNFHGEKLEGTVDAGKVHFVAKDNEGSTDEMNATVANGEMKGEIVATGSA